MENKYYIPEIEEFHKGFEYEMCLRNKEGETFWQHRTVEPQGWQGMWNIPFGTNAGYRVKYLNKEDIESLGFKDCSLSTSSHEMNIYQLNKKLTLNHIPHLQKLQITVDDKDRTPYSPGNYKQRIVFQGIIKNKSELKKVLKQLGI